MATVEINQGARQTYGPYDVETRNPAFVNVHGVKRQIVAPVNYDDLPSASEDDQTVISIPANSYITEAYFYEETAFNSTSGTTTVDIGLQQDDGTEIDNDGLFVDVITADGSAAGWTAGGGALIGATVGSAAGQIVATPSVSDLTAGYGVLVVEYIEVQGI